MTILMIPSPILAATLSTFMEQIWVEWVKPGAPIILAPVTAAVLGYFFNKSLQEKLDTDRAQRTEALELQKKNYSAELLTLGAELNRSLQEKLDDYRSQRAEALEHLKRDLQDTLASRTRRAEYLKSQIEKLYGPLTFLIESINSRIECAGHLEATKVEFRRRVNEGLIPKDTEPPDKNAIYEVQKKYFQLAAVASNEATKLLNSAWGWLDEDDQQDTIDYIERIDRNNVEYVELGIGLLPKQVYDKKVFPITGLELPTLRDDEFAKRIRLKLAQKQRELSGLTLTSETLTGTKQPSTATKTGAT
ncbi:hypothetical protein HUW62_37195 [Myxococcus sp. AM011]|uniref:hypothetical protein n=1 Tax=Myxococcus sp. AM011 TaxID=2745200 RepID=UPI0015955469|nr:hypothetical protein [Myxococcus sp. AM011]NVJ26870.1 hypothetical protein [Myxococcus sp. AM011]